MRNGFCPSSPSSSKLGVMLMAESTSLGGESSPNTFTPVAEFVSGTIAASTSPLSTSFLASSTLGAAVTSNASVCSAIAMAGPNAATLVWSPLEETILPMTMESSTAAMSTTVEMMNALLRRRMRISRSATSQVAAAVVGDSYVT